MPVALELPSLRVALWVWTRIGCLSFGGPAAQIAMMHRELVETRRWVSDRRFLHALSYCTLLPGPEATQLATYLGWLMHGVVGGLLAGWLFVLPGAAVMLALCLLYVGFGTVPLIAAAFFGLKCAVVVLVAAAVRRLAGKALRRPAARLLALGAFVALYFFAVPFPLVVLAAGLIGWGARDRFAADAPALGEVAPEAALDALLAADPARPARLAREAAWAGMAMLAAWLAPVALLAAHGGWLAELAWFFSTLAVSTFGGAYAVLAYAAQGAVGTYGWLTSGQMLDGLGLAETTPGPLILVLQYVGFLTGYAKAGLPGALAGSLVVLWVTFAPCFVWVFLGAPFVERLQASRAVSGALAAVTAAVVGVIASLALWFATHVLFREMLPLHGPLWRFDVPSPASLDIPAALLVCVAALALRRIGVLPVLAGAALAGMALHWQ